VFRAVERRRPREPVTAVLSRSPRRALVGSLVLGTIAAALGPHLAVVFLGVIVAGWSAFLLSHEPGQTRLPVVPVLTLLLLPAYWFLAIIAGPEGLGIEALPLVPLSPAAESLVAPTLLLVGWSLAGLWPLHRQLPGALTAPAGALLLIRVALPLARGGLEYLRPLASPLAVLGIWHAAAVGRWPLVAVGAAFLGAASATGPGAAGAGWLLGCGLLLELTSRLRGGVAARRAAEAAAWLVGAWGGLLVLQGALRGEVVYTALGVLGLAVIVVARRSPSEAPTSAPAR
jgi:hypothetical protein